jgi:hypothetical protein
MGRVGGEVGGGGVGYYTFSGLYRRSLQENHLKDASENRTGYLVKAVDCNPSFASTSSAGSCEKLASVYSDQFVRIFCVAVSRVYWFRIPSRHAMGPCRFHCQSKGSQTVVPIHLRRLKADLHPSLSTISVREYRERGGKAPRIRNLQTRWRWVVSFMLRLLYSWENSRRHDLGRLRGSHAWTKWWRRLGSERFILWRFRVGTAAFV